MTQVLAATAGGPDTQPAGATGHRVVTRFFLFAALVVFTGLFWAAGLRSSVVIDGTRHHYLDDDQMISMRYARNLADGQGAVWNAGERVEGYTNFGWMLVMAAVHELGATDATAALWVRGINWTLGCAVLLFSAWLLTAVGSNTPFTTALTVMVLASCRDLLFWALNGFETTMLTALFLWALIRAIGDGEQKVFRVGTCLTAGLLPIVRADAADLTAAVIVAAFAFGARRRWWLILLAAVPLLVHEAFRLAYYGDVFPNTYYLKVAGRSGLFMLGAAHLKNFAATYTVALVCVVASRFLSDRRGLWYLGALTAFGCARVLFVGPDIFPGFRFLAPYVPVLIVVSAATIAALGARQAAVRWTLASMLFLATAFNAGVSGRESFAELVSTQADPQANTVAGVVLLENAHRGSRVAVTAAGCLPYFSRLQAIDLLGKNDRHVARVKPATRGRPGVNRFDIDWSLRHRPDFVVAAVPYAVVSQPRHFLEKSLKSPAVDFTAALVLNETVVGEYRDHPVPIEYLLRRNPLLVYRDSPERLRLSEWRSPVIGRP